MRFPSSQTIFSPYIPLSASPGGPAHCHEFLPKPGISPEQALPVTRQDEALPGPLRTGLNHDPFIGGNRMLGKTILTKNDESARSTEGHSSGRGRDAERVESATKKFRFFPKRSTQRNPVELQVPPMDTVITYPTYPTLPSPSIRELVH